MNYYKEIEKLVADTGVISTDILVQQIKEDSKGDFAVPCFTHAKKLGINPMSLAQDLASKINLKNSPFEKAEAAAGYLNFFLNKRAFTEDVLERVTKEGNKFFVNKIDKPKTIGIDFSSVNLAKHFHIGHLRNTITGKTIANFYEAIGYKVIRFNYLGDYGTPFGEMLASAEKLNVDIMKCDVSALQNIYAQSKVFGADDEDFKAKGRKFFKDIVDGEKNAREKYEYIKKTTLDETQTIFDEFNIKFDSFDGEFYYSKFENEAIEALSKKGLLKESQGAKIVDLEADGLGAALIISSAGYSLYLTRDIASAMHRPLDFKLDEVLYITGSEQILNFKQLFRILELLELPIAMKKNLRHLAHGRYSLESGKLSSRDGAKALLKDIVAESKTRALAILEEKGKSGEDKNTLASKIGKAALIFSVLNYSAGKEIVFNLDRALSFEGETGPYLQYTYARISSIFDKAGSFERKLDNELNDDEFRLAKIINGFAEIITSAASELEPFYFTKYLLDLAKTFNKFYNENRILGNNSRLYICECVKKALEFGLTLIGIEPIDKM